MNAIVLKNIEIFPSKVVCIGRNYMEHIKELNNEIPEEMVFFIKPNSAISNKLVFPRNQNSCHYEAEISFLIEVFHGLTHLHRFYYQLHLSMEMKTHKTLKFHLVFVDLLYLV